VLLHDAVLDLLRRLSARLGFELSALHVDHGISRFEGLQTISSQGAEREFLRAARKLLDAQ